MLCDSAARAVAATLVPAPQTPAPQTSDDTRETVPNRVVTFSLRASADPGVLPRALELFAKRGLVPLSMRSELAASLDTLAVEIEVQGMGRRESDHVANCLRTIPMISQVMTSDRTLGA